MATKKIKRSAKKVTKKYDPTVLNITRQDIEKCFGFFDFFNVPLDPTLQALRIKLNAGGVLTVQDQTDLRKILAADVAKASHHVFHEKEFNGVRQGCAEVLVEIIKSETTK